MPIFDKEQAIEIVSDADSIDLSKSTMSTQLSSIEFDEEKQVFYCTIDKTLFSNPVDTIRSILDAHGFVSNLENILYCLDSFQFSVRIKRSSKAAHDKDAPYRVKAYLPCIRFELPQKGKIGQTLQSFYDEMAKYETNLSDTIIQAPLAEPKKKTTKQLQDEIDQLKKANQTLQQELNALNQQLVQEKNSLNRANRALDAQHALPENTQICRVEHVDLKRRIIKVKAFRKVIEIPTHLLDRVPQFQSRCLIAFDENDEKPLGILFFDNKEMETLERRTAELLHIEGDTFKARDSMRNEFQVKALNANEEATIRSLARGMSILVSIADNYIVRFSVLGAQPANYFKANIQEQLVVFDIGRNQLVNPSDLSAKQNE